MIRILSRSSPFRFALQVLRWTGQNAAAIVLVLFVAVCIWIAKWKPEENVEDPEVIVPAEKRHDYLDATVIKGLRYRGAGWEIRIGSVEIRRRSFGFIRVGALNEVVISEMHITLTPEHGAPDLIALFRAIGLPHEGAGDADSVPPIRRSPEFSGFMEPLFAHSPHANMRFSHARVDNISLSYETGPGKPDLILLEAPSAVIDRGQLRFSGAVKFGNLAGQRITCKTARLSLSEHPVLSIRDATLHTPDITQSIDRLSFPLTALLAGEDLL